MPDTVLRVKLTLARIRWLAGRHEDAFDALDRLIRHADARQLPRLLAYARLEQLRLHQLRGEQEAVLTCRDELAKLAPEAGADIGPWNVDLVLAAGQASMMVARQDGRWRDALQQCETLIDLCMRQGRRRRATDLAVQAAAMERYNGQASRAMERLRFAVRLGRSLGLVRTLLDADPSAGTLLREAAESAAFDAVDSLDARRLSAAAHRPTAPQPGEPSAAGSAISGSKEHADYRLNDRERDVASLLVQTYSNKQIAKVLGLSPETVKWHLKNLYLKLGVSSRMDVVERLKHEPRVFPQPDAGGEVRRSR